jgi:serine/threonine-protein kinase
MRPFALPLRTAMKDAEALDLYLRARRDYHGFTRESMKSAVELFDQALRRAPDDGRILSLQAAVLSRAWSMQSEVAHPHERALAAAQRARALAPELGEPHFAVAVIRLQEGRVMDAIEEIRQAVTKSPGVGAAREVLGRLLTESDALEEGLEQLDIGLALEPDLAGARLEVAKVHALTGDRERALAILDGMPEGSFAVRLMVMRIETWTGTDARGWSRLEGEESATAHELRTCLHDEQAGGLLPIVPVEREPVWRRTTYFTQLRVEMAMHLGRHDRALSLIEQAARANLFDVAWLRRCPLLAPLHDRPRFQQAQATIQARADEILAALRA